MARAWPNSSSGPKRRADGVPREIIAATVREDRDT